MGSASASPPPRQSISSSTSAPAAAASGAGNDQAKGQGCSLLTDACLESVGSGEVCR
jgi:hypothetical protein